MRLPIVPKANNKDCKACQYIRKFLILAAALLILMWAQPDWRLPPGFDDTTLTGGLFVWGFLALFAFKALQYYKNREL
jgi:hypothetical protein